MQTYRTLPQPVHIKGTMRGEEKVLEKGREPGRRRSQQGLATWEQTTKRLPPATETAEVPA